MMHERIGKYHVIRQAGSGGFGVVYEGYDSALDRNVAIKVCTSDDPSELARFQREARIVSRLQHRNIAQVYESGYDSEADVHYLVEEFLSGVDLETKLREGDRLPAPLRVAYLREISQGLAFAHTNALIHRDLSPRNVRVLHNHTIKIMDFGLAKDELDSTITMIGDNFGTVGYTAPEQLLQMRLVDLRTDIFSFGVMAYELLSCRHPFPCQRAAEFLTLVERGPPIPITENWPKCPAELAQMIHRAMAVDPEDRQASFDEIIPVLKESLGYLRNNAVPAPYLPQVAVPQRQEPRNLTDDFLSTPIPLAPSRIGAKTNVVPPPLDERIEALDGTFQASVTRKLPRRGRRLPSWLAGAGAAALLIVALGLWAAVRPAAEKSAIAADPGEKTGDEAPPADDGRSRGLRPQVTTAPTGTAKEAPRETPSRRAPHRAIDLQISQLPETTGFLLRAALPRLEDASHCYISRDPPWSAGPKLRKDLKASRNEILHKDTREIGVGESYRYQILIADSEGQVVAESLEVEAVAAGD